jgi:hypothetical protein
MAEMVDQYGIVIAQRDPSPHPENATTALQRRRSAEDVTLDHIAAEIPSKLFTSRGECVSEAQVHGSVVDDQSLRAIALAKAKTNSQTYHQTTSC